MRRCFGVIAALLVASVSLSAVAAGRASVVQGHVRVVDGDTVALGPQRIRFFGIDAPESTQICDRGARAWRCGLAAKDMLAQKIGGEPVQCEVKDTDPYGRLVAVCYTARGEDLNAWMVSQGLAIAYTQYSRVYVGLEARAKANRYGVWAGPFERPDAYRHEGVAQQAPIDDRTFGRTTDGYRSPARYAPDSDEEVGYADEANSAFRSGAANGERIPQDTTRPTFKGMACVVLGKGCQQP
jgi:endonuclease YncB( thermonuclease family)